MPKIAAVVANRWLGAILARAGAHQKPKRLMIFDFDGTSFRSPGPPEGAKEPEAWWSDPASLNPPHVDKRPSEEMWHPDTIDRMKEGLKDPETYVVVMTGRHSSLKDRIQELLDSAGLDVDELITNPEIGGTTQYKKDEMLYLLKQLPNVRDVEFWEDRPDDLRNYQKAAEKAGKRFTPRLVDNFESGKSPLYTGVFLTPDARRKLLKDFKAEHPNLEADHVTLTFQPNEDQLEEFRKQFSMGQRVPLKVTGIAQDDKIQALKVELPDSLREFGKNSPHITLSRAEGVPPSYSNEMLKNTKAKPVGPKVYEAYVDLGPRPGTARRREDAAKEKATRGEKDLGPLREEWDRFLDETVRNPEYGKPGHSKRHVKRRTIYKSDPAGKRRVLHEWENHLRGRY